MINETRRDIMKSIKALVIAAAGIVILGVAGITMSSFRQPEKRKCIWYGLMSLIMTDCLMQPSGAMILAMDAHHFVVGAITNYNIIPQADLKTHV